MLGRLKLWAIAVLSVALAILTIRGSRSKAEIERLDSYVQTRKEIDEAPNDVDDAGGPREWLYERQRQRGGDL